MNKSIPTAPDMSKKCENLNTSPLTPISFSERLPERGERIFVFDSLTKEWVKMQAGDMEPTFHPDFTHWLPQDALPVPVEGKSKDSKIEWLRNLCEGEDMGCGGFGFPPKVRDAIIELADRIDALEAKE